MSQWGQGQPGFQYPMQTGFPGGNPQFQQNAQFQPQNPQFQQPNPQFQQQGGMMPNGGGGMVPQPTGFPGQQRMGGMMQPQQTGFPGQMQPQQTGFPGGGFQQQQQRQAPPVPPVPSQFQQNRPSFLNAPPPQQPNRLMASSPGFGGGGLVPQQTGFGGPSGGLVPQMTGFVDPRLTMMSQTFMPMNTSSPFNAQGLPIMQPQSQNLMQSIQQHNQTQRGTTTQQMSWTLNKNEKKNYDNIFRQWVQGQPFMDGKTAIEVFGASGLPQDDLARVWTLADVEDRGKLNLAEFHVAMALIYRRLNGMPLPDQLPQELIPPSRRDLDDSVDRVKDLLHRESRAHTPSTDPVSYLKNRSFNSASPSFDTNRDATIYKHSDTDTSSVYKPRSRHVDRDAIRSRMDEDSPSADIQDMKRALANTSYMLDKAAESDTQKSREDEELDREMDDLKYRVKRVREDLDYHAHRPKTASGEEERRRLEREMLNLMHERIPEVERKIKAREERKEREKREWARERDRANDRFGRYDRGGGGDDYSRREDRDRPYSRGAYDDRDRDYRSASRGDYRDRTDDRDRPYSRGAYDDRDRDNRDRRDYDRPRSPPSSRTAPPPPPEAPASSIRDAPAPPPPPQAAPSPSISSMTPEQRKAYLQEQARLRIQARMKTLGVTAPSGSPTLDTSVEDRLQQERKEAEEKAKAAEKQAEERERVRKERVDNEKALKEGRTTPVAPTPTPAAPAPTTPKVAPPAPTPKAAAKAAPPPPKPRAAAPPPPKPRTAVRAPPVVAAVATPPPPTPPAPAPVPEVDLEEEAFRAREASLRKAREDREKARLERERKLRELEELEAAAEREEEERYQQRLQSLKAKSPKPPSPPPAPTSPVQAQAVAPPPPINPPAPPATGPASAPVEKSTNPFSKLLKEGGGASSTASTPANTSSANPWAKPQTTPLVPPQPSKSPAPPSAVSTKGGYQTAPSSAIDDDWDDVQEREEEDDSSDDEFTASKAARDRIAQAVFGNMVTRPSSGATSSPATPAPGASAGGSAPPPPPPPAPVAPGIPGAPPPPPAPTAPIVKPVASSDRGALFASIQGGRALRPTKTLDKSGPQLSGKVLGDVGPPAHIATAARPPSPPSPPRAPSPQAPTLSLVTPSMGSEGMSKSDNRQSVGWFADRAADLGESPVLVERMPSTLELDEDESEDAPVPDIMVNEHVEPVSDLMADIDKGVEHRVRSLYSFEGDGPDDLSFGENLMIVANPSKSGGDWWFGKTVNNGKSGLFPKTYVEVVTPKQAKAAFSYTGDNPDELPFNEGDILTIVDTTEAEWWKAEQGGVVFIVPAAYLELVEAVSGVFGSITTPNIKQEVAFHADSSPMQSVNTNDQPSSSVLDPRKDHLDDHNRNDEDTDSDDSASSSDYLSFDDSDNEDDADEKARRERERQLVLEAAGLIVKQDVGPPPTRPKRRPAPAAPAKRRPNGPERMPSMYKELPPVPSVLEPDTDEEAPPTPDPELSHEARLDDAFARYESFKNVQANMNRLSVVSTNSSIEAGSTTSSAMTAPTSVSSTPSHSSQINKAEVDSGSRYSHFLHFLRSKTPDSEQPQRRRSASTLKISAPMMIQAHSNASSSGGQPSSPTIPGHPSTPDVAHRSSSPSFGTSWASLVDKTALEGIPPGERKRQEAIFELINTEVAYVRDLQLIVEVFYSSMLPLLSSKETTVVFANIEDILLVNTGFVSSLEERQKDCRLYVDRIGDILLSHVPNMGAYMEYCVNQATAIKVLQSLRDTNPELALHLQRVRDENPAARSLDLSSYLLAPMQRITRYPLLIKQILHYTEAGKEREANATAHDMAEKLLEHINEAIRDQENQTTLKTISQSLWIGQGRLDLTAPTRNMGPRKLLKQGYLLKTKSGRKLNAFLCSDILVLTDETAKNLYRMPIPLPHAQLTHVGSDTFQVSQPYPRGGDKISLRAQNPKDCQQWVQDINQAIKRARHAEERMARKAARR